MSTTPMPPPSPGSAPSPSLTVSYAPPEIAASSPTIDHQPPSASLSQRKVYHRMATNLSGQHATTSTDPVIQWLLDSDPSIRWQALRDLTDAPAEEVAAERARVATEGAGAQVLALQPPDGRWG